MLKISGIDPVPTAEIAYFEANFRQNPRKNRLNGWLKGLIGKYHILEAKIPNFPWETLRKVIVSSIPTGKGDQLLRLFGTRNRAFYSPFWEFRPKYPWVNEILLRNINFNYSSLLRSLHVILTSLKKKC